jgi:putative ABC transport system ATP-binding protein
MELAGVADAHDRARIELEAVGLGHRTGHYPAQLSGGEQQRVAIARATAPEPSLLFADEPTGNLDVTTGAAIVDLLFARCAKKGATLFIITHDPTLARQCERIIELEDGQIVRDRSGEGRAAA